jgi:hypothetical protein
VSTRRGGRNRKSGESDGTSVAQSPRQRLNLTATVIPIEPGVKELGTHAQLSDLVAKARFIEKEISQSRYRL